MAMGLAAAGAARIVRAERLPSTEKFRKSVNTRGELDHGVCSGTNGAIIDNSQLRCRDARKRDRGRW